jgi:hypothetical protein
MSVKDQKLLNGSPSNSPDHWRKDGLSKMQGFNDAGAVLGLFLNFLRLEMYQLRRDRRQDHREQSPEKPGRFTS